MNARTSARRADTSGLSTRSVISESLHVLEPGSQVQNAIYLAGGSEWPISPEEWETRAREMLEQGPFDYVAGGAGSEATVRANREAFERRRLRPRMLTGNAERDLSVEVLGLASPAPFLLGPVGVLSIVHPEAELGVARASKATGVPMVLSSAASTSLEDVAAELRRAGVVPALLVGRPRAGGQPRRPRRRGRLRRDRRHARHADARLARPRPPQRLPAVPAGRGPGAVLQPTRSSASGSTRRPRRTCRRRR